MATFFALILLLLPLVSFAQDFVPLVGIPFMDTPTRDTTLGDYAQAFYIAAISLGAVIAVLKIIFAGVKYMLTDVVTDKSQAKNDIKGALLGLILIIGAVLILETISPDITSLRAFNLTALDIQAPVAVDPEEALEQEVTETCTTTGEDEFCMRESCYFDCEAWCTEEMNGTYVPSGGNSSNICVFQGDGTEGELIDRESIGVFTCNMTDPGTTDFDFGTVITPPTFDCTGAEQQCSAAGGTDTIDHGTNVECVRETTNPNYNLVEKMYSCTDMSGSNQQQCEPVRTYCRNQGGTPEDVTQNLGRNGTRPIGVRCRFD